MASRWNALDQVDHRPWPIPERKRGGKAGVWLFSLDAASRLAVETARAWFHLPYFHANILGRDTAHGWIEYACDRRDRRGKHASFRAKYRPAGEAARATAGTLEHWLVERYCFFAVDGRERVSRSDVHHSPWSLQGAEAVVEANTMANAAGMRCPRSRPSFTSREGSMWWAGHPFQFDRATVRRDVGCGRSTS